MYNDGHDRYAIKDIISCGEVTWERYCKDKEIYEKIFYNIMLTVDLHKNCDIKVWCNGKLYREKGNILSIRKDNAFSNMLIDSPFDKWYMIAMLCDIVRKKSEGFSEIIDKIYELAENTPVVKISDEACAMLQEKFSRLCNLHTNGREERDLQSFELLDSIVRCFRNGAPIPGEPIQIGVEKMDKVIDYIKNHIDSKLTVDEISDVCYFDKYHLSKAFKKYTDHTINQFVTVYRVLRSIVYLFDGDSVEEAGKKSGFKNASTYIKAFKMVNYNITPKQFIKRNIE